MDGCCNSHGATIEAVHSRTERRTQKGKEDEGIATRGVCQVSTAGSSDWSDGKAIVRDCGRLSTLGDDASVEETDDEDGAFGVVASVIREATRLLKSFRPKNRRQVGNH